MTNTFNYPQGSIWRKWDLHVHTPFSYLNNQFGNNFDDYVKQLFQKAIEKSITAIGLTDYFTIDGYKKLKNDYLNNNGKLEKLQFSKEEIEKIKNILIVPNVEFRLNKLVGKKRINFHVIFSNEIEINDIEENFLREIKFVYEGGPQTEDEKRALTLQNLEDLGKKLKSENEKFQDKSDIEVGMMNAVVDDTEIVKILSNKRSIFEGKYLILVPADEDLSQINWNGQDHQTRKVLIQKCDGLFASNKNTIEWALGKKHSSPQDFINEFKSLKPCLWGSDAHSFEKLFEPDANRYTWIKADPTFEGLKQILYEPEERVRIQEENPEYEFDKPTFSKVKIESSIEVFENEKVKFDQQEIPLNKNLVTIIGGRGSGKSLLLNYIANTLNKPILAYQKREGNQTQFNNSENFIIEWQKNNNPTPETITLNCKDKGQLDFIFIEQGKLKNISDYKILAEEIKVLLSIEKLQFDTKLDSEILHLLREIQEIKNWFEYENEQKEKINSREYNEQKKNKAENLLKTITTEANKQKLQKYTSNISEITECEKLLSRLQELKETLAKRESELNEVINVINDEIGLYKFQEEIPKIDFKSQNERIKNIESKLGEILQNKKNENETIKKEFEEHGFKGDLGTLLSNAEKYQKNIQEADSQLKEIERREKLLNEKLQERNKLADKIKGEYERLIKEIDNSWKNILNKFNGNQKEIIEKLLQKSNVLICGKIYFDLKKFDEKLKEYLDLRKYKNLSKDIGIKNLEDYWNFIKNYLNDYIEGDKRETTKKTLDELFFDLKERRDYLYVIPEIKFRDKTLDKLSVGQRGTLYVLLQLATNTFSSPLIFDQPEDDLDNEFIVKELVNLFKELKKYRQLIIATHNANLVVTADAEQIIVAQNEEEKLTYSTGALENPGIINSVCTILEGGKEAFEKREKKYGFR